MANTPGKFTGARIQPVAAGKAEAQQPNSGTNSKKQGHLLRDLEKTKLEGDPLTLNGRSEDTSVWGEDPINPGNNEESRGDRLILHYSKADFEKIVIGCDKPSEMWFQCDGGQFRWIIDGAVGFVPFTASADMVLKQSSSGLPLLLIGNDSGALFSATSTLDVDGSISLATRQITGNRTLDETDLLVLCDTTGGNITVTLPLAAAATQGRMYVVKKLVAANTVTISPSSGQTIDGAASKALTLQYDTYALINDSTQWHGLFSGVP